MISHGDYYTVYSKLKSVSVQKGEKVSFGQELGIVNTTRDGVTELGFQIWREMEKENPENWLIKGNI
jgi:septal ring factor EnvC (AmiA/AmiB activator)